MPSTTLGSETKHEVELNFTAPFGVVLRAYRKAAGLTQLQLAVELNRDHTYVSRWETGRLRPEAADVYGIAAALALGAQERVLLRNAWARTFGDEAGPGVGDPSVSLTAAATLRRLGQPRVAYELAARDGRLALERARTARLADGELRCLLDLAGSLLLEEVKGALDFATDVDVRAGLLAENAREHQLVCVGLGGRRAQVRWCVAEEAMRYGAGDVEGAHRVTTTFFDSLTDGEPEWLAETIRAVAINSGVLGDDAALQRAWRRFLDAEAHLPEELRRFALEGFIRGFTRTAPDRAFEIVEDAYSSLAAEGVASAVRRVQLARSEGRLMVHVSGTVGDSETRRRVEAALVASRSLELDKYVNELEALLVAGSRRQIVT